MIFSVPESVTYEKTTSSVGVPVAADVFVLENPFLDSSRPFFAIMQLSACVA
jgi:hypothetical protein